MKKTANSFVFFSLSLKPISITSLIMNRMLCMLFCSIPNVFRCFRAVSSWIFRCSARVAHTYMRSTLVAHVFVTQFTLLIEWKLSLIKVNHHQCVLFAVLWPLNNVRKPAKRKHTRMTRFVVYRKFVVNKLWATTEKEEITFNQFPLKMKHHYYTQNSEIEREKVNKLSLL